MVNSESICIKSNKLTKLNLPQRTHIVNETVNAGITLNKPRGYATCKFYREIQQVYLRKSAEVGCCCAAGFSAVFSIRNIE